MEFDIEYPTLSGLIGRYKNARVVIQQEMVVGMNRAMRPMERDAKADSPWDTGHLRRSITVKVVTRGDLTIGTLGTNVPYGKIIEDGRNPGRMPPPGVLIGWMRRHGIDLGAPPTISMPYYRNEYLLARAINARKTRAQPYLIPAFIKNLTNAKRELTTKTVTRVIRRLAPGST